jgi:hypothetical protein
MSNQPVEREALRGFRSDGSHAGKGSGIASSELYNRAVETLGTVRFSHSMNFIKNLPRISLLFLFAAYTFLGWFVADSIAVWHDWVWASICWGSGTRRAPICAFLTNPYFPWIALSIAIVLIALALIHPMTEIKSVFGNWLQSDAKAFLSVIAIAFFTVVVLTRSDLLAEGLGLIAPGLLARIELQLAGYNDWQSFGIITIICLTGYGFGLFLHQSWKL